MLFCGQVITHNDIFRSLLQSASPSTGQQAGLMDQRSTAPGAPVTAGIAMSVTPALLFVTTCWWPSLARLAQVFQQAGFRVALVCPKGHPGLAVPGITVFDYAPIRSLRCLSRAIMTVQPDFVIPGDDRAAAHLHRLYETGTSQERHLIRRSLGDPASYPIIRSRAALLAQAGQAGMKVPPGAAITSRAALSDWMHAASAPWVLKSDGAWSGHGVRVAHTERQARAAFAELSRGVGWAASLKRLAINRDLFWLGDWLGRDKPQVSAQGWIEGGTGNLAMFCRDGEVLASITAESVVCWGDTGPSTIIRMVEHEAFTQGARALAASLRLSGFIGLDFMMDATTGEPILIEMNPRATPLCNIRGPGQDLLAAAAQSWGGPDMPVPRALTGALIAHFPLAWHWNHADERLKHCQQDIPWETPALVDAMLQASWPDRQWPARLLAWLQRRLGADDHLAHVHLTGIVDLPAPNEIFGRQMGHPSGAPAGD